MRAIKKMGSDLREQRGDHDKVPKGVRKGSSSVPHSSLSLLCFGVGSGALLHTNVSWLLAGSPNERQWGQIRGWERGSRNSISYWTGSLVSSFSRVITGLGSGDLCLHLQPGSGSSFLLQLISAVPHCPLVGGSVFPSPVVNPLYLNLESGFYISGWALMGMVGFPGAVIGAASERERKNCLDRESRKTILNTLGSLRSLSVGIQEGQTTGSGEPATTFRKGIKCSGILENSPDSFCSVDW